mgnify:CR=1 FL=1
MYFWEFILRKKIKYMISSILFVIIFSYLAILFFIYFNQRNLLYHPSENNYLNEKANFVYEEVYIPSTENNLKGWFHKKNLTKNKTLVFFHGNAGSLENRIYKLNLIKDFDLNFLIIAYRGFSGNKGKPTERGLYEDALSALKWLKTNYSIKDKDIIIYGESLGTSISIEVSQNKKYSGIILESPFTSMTDAAKHYYPYLPVSLLLKDKYDSIEKIKNINIPILVMHGKKDKIIPFEMGKKIFESANQPKFFYSPDNDDHMMNYDENLLKTIRSFLEKI